MISTYMLLHLLHDCVGQGGTAPNQEQFRHELAALRVQLAKAVQAGDIAHAYDAQDAQTAVDRAIERSNILRIQIPSILSFEPLRLQRPRISMRTHCSILILTATFVVLLWNLHASAPTSRSSLTNRSRLTLMRPPWSRDRLALRAGAARLCRHASDQARFTSGNVFRLHCRRLVHLRDCTTHVLRGYRHRGGGADYGGEDEAASCLFTALKNWATIILTAPSSSRCPTLAIGPPTWTSP